MTKDNENIWLKAAVIGSIWASFEIVFGSFFHSLRIPFAGTLLTFFSIILLISFSYKWQGKNLFLKAGIIAALMRSLMPTSVILGPLIGIMIEAVLFQISINLFKRNLLAFSIAGILAMFSAIIHKVVSIILIYGFDIVKILKNLYYVFLHTTHLKLPLNDLFIIVVTAYVIVGFLSAIIGNQIGKSINKIDTKIGDNTIKLDVKNNIFELPDFHYHSKYIIFHLIILVATLFTLEIFPLQYIIIPLSIYMFFLFKRYGKSLRRLAKPLFWLQLVVIVLIAVWLWNDKIEGFIVGIKMIIRAILVVSVFTAISVELKNPLVKSLLYKKGYSQLYATLGLATAAVPFILKNLSVQKKDFLNPFKILKKSIGLSDILLEEFTNFIQKKNKIYIISGETRSGKTTFLKKIIKALKEQNPQVKIGGIIAHGIDKNNERLGFEIEDIYTGKKHQLCTTTQKPDSIKIGRFWFFEEGFRFGRKAIETNINDLDLLVIDEIGYLELKGKGWFSSIEKAMQNQDLDMIWVVRKRILEEVMKQWQHANFEVIKVENTNLEKFVLRFEKRTSSI